MNNETIIMYTLDEAREIIHKELNTDIGFEIPSHGNLET